MNCSICGASVHVEASKCGECAAPQDERASSGERSECSRCGEVLWSLAETCPHCGARGYPALRPRLGDKSLGAPGEEVNV